MIFPRARSFGISLCNHSSSLLPTSTVHSSHLFLARLLDTLRPGVQRTLAALDFACQLIASLLVYYARISIALCCVCGHGTRKRTGCLLRLECELFLVEFLGLLLGLLVVDGVGTGCGKNVSVFATRWVVVG